MIWWIVRCEAWGDPDPRHRQHHDRPHSQHFDHTPPFHPYILRLECTTRSLRRSYKRVGWCPAKFSSWTLNWARWSFTFDHVLPYDAWKFQGIRQNRWPYSTFWLCFFFKQTTMIITIMLCLQLRFLVFQHTALFSTFILLLCLSSVTGVTYQLFLIIWWFVP